MMVTLKIILFLCILTIGQGKQVRIQNGEDAAPGELPFQVSIQYRSNSVHYCSGSILNENYVITAAHCTQTDKFLVPPEAIKVAVGLTHTKPDEIHNVKSIIRHKYFSRRDFLKNDIALLKVTPPFVFNDFISPVKLPKPHELINPGTTAIVSGWGSTTSNKITLSEKLKKLKAPVISEDECRKLYNPTSNNIYSVHLCTLDRSGMERGPRSHDSGGPLTIDDNVLIGIISWGHVDADGRRLHYPNVYTRVSEFVDWIEKNAK